MNFTSLIHPRADLSAEVVNSFFPKPGLSLYKSPLDGVYRVTIETRMSHWCQSLYESSAPQLGQHSAEIEARYR